MAWPLKPFTAGAPRATGDRSTAVFTLVPPFVHGTSASPRASRREDLPPVEDFLDTLPSVADFAPDPARDEWASWDAPAPSVESASEDNWGSNALAGFDWRAAGDLGASPAAAPVAESAWSTTEWEDKRQPRRQTQTAGEAIAEALDQIARRIRSGELTVPGSEAATSDVAIATTLAALLGMRR